jgi:hypothetical protein
MGKKRSKATSKKNKAKVAAHYKHQVKQTPLAGAALAGAIRGAKGKGQRDHAQQASQTNQPNAMLTIESSGSSRKNSKLDSSSSVKKQLKKKQKALLSKWGTTPSNKNRNSTTSKAAGGGTDEHADFAREAASLRERQHNDKVKREGANSVRKQGGIQMQPATLKVHPANLNELVGQTARQVEQSNMISSLPTPTPMSTPTSSFSQSFPGQSVVGSTNILSQMAAQKRKETYMQQTYMLKPCDISIKDPMSNNKFAAFVGHDDESDDDETSRQPEVKPMLFSPASFNFQSSFAGQTSLVLPNNSTTFVVGDGSEDMDPDL